MNSNLKIISDLTEEITEAIKNGVHPEKIMAITCTTKVADELIERIRTRLLELGDTESATGILNGYVGTANCVFGRLLRELALERGLSPTQKVLSDTEAGSLFHTTVSGTIDKFYHKNSEVFYRLGLDNRNNDWRNKVFEIVKLARQNGLSSEEVKECADYSWEIMKSWLPMSHSTSEQLDKGLESALKFAESTLPGGDSTRLTLKVVEKIKLALVDWKRNGYLSWEQWAELSKLAPGKRSEDDVSQVCATASVHYAHPRLHGDMKEAIFALFHCAAEAMEKYVEEKNKRGVIDFIDQEFLALELLTDKENEKALKERISAVFVDEFQDLSPLQIAINMQLLNIADNVAWTGDVKQAIYGFRGTDPMEQALAIETWSWRDSGSKDIGTDAAHIAVGMKEVIDQRDEYLVMDKITKSLRPLKAGDIAVLCKSNRDCVKVASALSKIGISATVGKSGLMETQEVAYDVAEYTDKDAVHVLTYDKSKGLEWPFVILYSLGRSSKRDKLPVFDNVIAVSTKEFDIENPLDGRKLYYCPWPYGNRKRKVDLDGFVENTKELREKEEQLLKENQRLMYVGITRANDYLVFVDRDYSKIGSIDDKGQKVIANLGVIEEDLEDDSSGNKIGKIVVNGERFTCKIKEISIAEGK